MPTCPECSLHNPEGSAWCDCGHEFDEKLAAEWRRAGHRPRHETSPPPLSTGKKVAVGFLGFLVGSFPFGFANELNVASGDPSSPLFTLLRWGGGVLGAWLAVRWLEAKHENATS